MADTSSLDPLLLLKSFDLTAQGFPYREYVVGFSLLVFLFHTYLDLRQYRMLQKDKPPAVLESLFTQETYLKAKAYSLEKWWFGLIKGVYDEAFGILQLFYLAQGWRYAGEVHATYANSLWGEMGHTISFVLIFTWLTTATSIPWSLYKTFVVEARHGFNKQTLAVFVMDIVKSLVLGLLLIPPVVAAITWILQKAGPFIALYLAGFMVLLSLFLLTIYPTVIAPLFNTFTPLQDGSLKHSIDELAAGLKFPLKKLFVIDGSTRSAHSNAYMYGFFNNKRIVLFDTLIEQCTEQQVVAVLAHELGHWKLKHTWTNYLVQNAVMLAQFGVFTFFRSNPYLYEAFGFQGERPAFMALFLYQLLSGPVDEVLGFCFNIISRLFEFQADAFAVGLNYKEDLKGALVKLQEKNLSALNVDPWYSTYHYSHPPLAERLEAIDVQGKKE